MMTLAQAAQCLHVSVPGNSEAVFLRVVIDSRQVQPGDLFVALRGDTFDGHDFVAQAIAQGAVGAIVERASEVGPCIVVPDTVVALGQLAKYWRQQMAVKLLAITGSSGKTTVKEMLATILRAAFGTEAVLATRGNFNNHIGLPLTLLSLKSTHRFAVIEMGMSDFGEIRYLSELAQPDVAMVNNAQGAHLAALGSVEGVARAKAEIFSGLSAHGIAVINADDDFAESWRQAAQHLAQLSFGLKQADIHADDIVLHAGSTTWTLVCPRHTASVQLAVPGLHNVRNALAASAVAFACGLDGQQIARGLAQFAGVPGRLTQKTAFNGALLIDDTYNANPGSIRAAIDVLAQYASPRLLILGDIGEAGTDAAEMHRLLGTYAREKGIETLLTLGENMAFAAAAFAEQRGGSSEHFTTLNALLTRAREVIRTDSTVLVKGSRFMRMERVVAALETVVEKVH